MNAISRIAAVQSAPALSRVQRIDIAIAALNAKGNQKFKAIHDIERMHIDDLRELPTTGTILQPVVNALNAQGVATDGTVGGLMRSLEFDSDDVHYVACWCHEENEEISGTWAAERFTDLRDGFIPVASTYSA